MFLFCFLSTPPPLVNPWGNCCVGRFFRFNALPSPLPEPSKPAVRKRVARTIRGPAWRVHFPMRTDDQGTAVALPAALLQIPNQLLARFELRAGRLVAIEIAHETNAEPDVVHIIAVHVAAVNLAAPAIADFDLAVARRGPVSDDEMVGQAIPHAPNLAVIIIESSRVALPRAAVVHDDKFPASALDRRSSNRVDSRTGQIMIVRRLPRPRPEATLRRRWWRRFEALFLFQAGFFNRDIRRQRGLRQGRTRNRTGARGRFRSRSARWFGSGLGRLLYRRGSFRRLGFLDPLWSSLRCVCLFLRAGFWSGRFVRFRRWALLGATFFCRLRRLFRLSLFSASASVSPLCPSRSIVLFPISLCSSRRAIRPVPALGSSGQQAFLPVPEIRPTQPSRFVLALGSPFRPARSTYLFPISLCSSRRAIRPVRALNSSSWPPALRSISASEPAFC